jgi:hypothetical protein
MKSSSAQLYRAFGTARRLRAAPHAQDALGAEGAGLQGPDDIVDDEDCLRDHRGLRPEPVLERTDQWSDPTTNQARRLVLFKESWMRLDVNGDGIAELRRICTVGKNASRG